MGSGIWKTSLVQGTTVYTQMIELLHLCRVCCRVAQPNFANDVGFPKTSTQPTIFYLCVYLDTPPTSSRGEC